MGEAEDTACPYRCVVVGLGEIARRMAIKTDGARPVPTESLGLRNDDSDGVDNARADENAVKRRSGTAGVHAGALHLCTDAKKRVPTSRAGCGYSACHAPTPATA